MTLAEIITIVRARTDDTVGPEYRVSDSMMTGFANEAENEACERAALIYDSTTPGVCQVTLEPGESSYPLDPAILTVCRAWTGGRALTHVPTSSLWLEDLATQSGTPRYFFSAGHTLRLYPTPDTDGTLTLATYRYPLNAMEDPDDEPEIPREYHLDLAAWMTYRAASQFGEDGEVYDPKLAEGELMRFERRFGRPRTATEIRSWRELPRDTHVRLRTP